MNRKQFIQGSALSAAAILTVNVGFSSVVDRLGKKPIQPLAITMWDFSWLERRWSGGSYEDWDKALDELVSRGYNAVRIDAYPHLVATGPQKEWTLKPVWDQNDWGSPGLLKVQVQPSLSSFIAKCKKRNIKVGLSTWYREDADNTRLLIDSPEKMAANWLTVLDGLAGENLLDTILYVDLCNEWPAQIWTPFFKAKRRGHDWSTPESIDWMKRAIDTVKKKYPAIPCTFSMDHYQAGVLAKNPVPSLDFIEQHMWMASLQEGAFNNQVGIDWNGFSSGDYKKLVEKGEAIYKQNEARWNELLVSSIRQMATDAKTVNQPLITTEGWSLVNYKDYPMLNWDWIKGLCALGISTAAATGQWVAMATSNFCGPQFVGMWADTDWHNKMTKIIKNASIAEPIKNSAIVKRIGG
jgi:hypothetical protein